jgi:hypothetical protein
MLQQRETGLTSNPSPPSKVGRETNEKRETSLTSNLRPSHGRLLQEMSIIVYCGDHTEHICTWCGRNKPYGMFQASDSCSYHCAVKQRLSAFFPTTTLVLQRRCPIARNVRSSTVYESPNSVVRKTDYGVRIYNVRKCALCEVGSCLFKRLFRVGRCFEAACRHCLLHATEFEVRKKSTRRMCAHSSVGF